MWRKKEEEEGGGVEKSGLSRVLWRLESKTLTGFTNYTHPLTHAHTHTRTHTHTHTCAAAINTHKASDLVVSKYATWC